VDSVPGMGSTFHFTATFTMVNVPFEAENRNANWLRGKRVLVVDDNQVTRSILEKMMGEWGAATTLAQSAGEAHAFLEHAQKTGQPYAVLLTDCHMPDVDGFTLARNVQKDPALAGVRIIMMIAGGRHGDAAQCRQIGAHGYLVKPVARAELRGVIARALEPPPSTPAPRRGPSSERRPEPPLRILLVEDNTVNQKVALLMLQKGGHIVELAENGQKALDATARQRFDLVLMDVQMPEMDGLEATSRIRKRESVSGGHIPIIAMTAHAMAKDKERCLASGMDAYITKPVRSGDLVEAIAAWRPDDVMTPR
jgi:two-component system sensor histidine kinase/response regulator